MFWIIGGRDFLLAVAGLFFAEIAYRPEYRNAPRRVERLHLLRFHLSPVCLHGRSGHSLLSVEAGRTGREHRPGVLENLPPHGAAGSSGTDLQQPHVCDGSCPPSFASRAGANRFGLFLCLDHHAAHVGAHRRGLDRVDLGGILGSHDGYSRAGCGARRARHARRIAGGLRQPPGAARPRVTGCTTRPRKAPPCPRKPRGVAGHDPHHRRRELCGVLAGEWLRRPRTAAMPRRADCCWPA